MGVMKDQQGFEWLNQSAVSIEYQQTQYIVSTLNFKTGSSAHDRSRDLRHFVNGFFGDVFHD